MTENTLLVEHIKGVLQELRVNPEDDPGNPPDTFNFPVGVRKIAVSAVNPKNISASDMPVMFYGTGELSVLRGDRFGTNFRGYTYRIIANIVFEKLTGDTRLIESAARMTDAVSAAAENIKNPKENSPFAIDDAFIENALPFSDGLSDREFMRYVIATNFYYAI